MGITYGKAIIDGVETSSLSSISSASSNVSIQFGYPTATSDGVINALEKMKKDSDWAYSSDLKTKMIHQYRQLRTLSPTQIQNIDKVVAAEKKNPIGAVRFAFFAGTCQWYSQKEVDKGYYRKKPAHRNNVWKKEQCNYADEASQDKGNSDKDNNSSSVTPSQQNREKMIITLKKYEPYLKNNQPIPKGCYLTYIAAQNANTPAMVELSPTACLTNSLFG